MKASVLKRSGEETWGSHRLTSTGGSHGGGRGPGQPQLVLQGEVDVVPLGSSVHWFGRHHQVGVLTHVQNLQEQSAMDDFHHTVCLLSTAECRRHAKCRGQGHTSKSVRKWTASGSVTSRFLFSTSFFSLPHLKRRTSAIGICGGKNAKGC